MSPVDIESQIAKARRAVDIAERRAENFDRTNPRLQQQLNQAANEARMRLINLEKARDQQAEG